MLGKLTILSALVVLGLAVPAAARTGTWSEYQDEVYNCRLEYPATLFTQDAYDVAEAFQRFSGPDAQTYFRVMGVDNEEGLTPRRIMAKYLNADIPGDIVYRRAKDRFLVLSGYRGNSIFYTKVTLSADNRRICVFEITYPREAKASFDDTVTRMSRSFVVGKFSIEATQ